MRRAIADAEVGDDVLDGDPTTRRLEARVAELLGHEASLFFPSGTQANQVALGLLGAPGTEVILEASAHILHYEQAGPAVLWGLQLRPIVTPDGLLTPELVSSVIRPKAPFYPSTSVLTVENTHNAAGGKVMRRDDLAALSKLAESRGIGLHLDGARLWNAAVAQGVEPGELASLATTVMVSFSKGLGCPVGSCLAGPAELMREGVELRRRLGGGMRQTGILTAAALWALDHRLGAIARDHERARHFADLVSSAGIVDVVPPDSNIVMLDLRSGSASDARRALADAGVLTSIFGPRRLRVVMHGQVGDEQVTWAAGTTVRVLEETVR